MQSEAGPAPSRPHQPNFLGPQWGLWTQHPGQAREGPVWVGGWEAPSTPCSRAWDRGTGFHQIPWLARGPREEGQSPESLGHTLPWLWKTRPSLSQNLAKFTAGSPTVRASQESMMPLRKQAASQTERATALGPSPRPPPAVSTSAPCSCCRIHIRWLWDLSSYPSSPGTAAPGPDNASG